MEKQKKLKFNLVDVIFVLVLLAGAAFVALRIIGLGSDAPGEDEGKEKEGEEYIITLYTGESADYVIDHLRLGAQVTDDSITLDLGTVVDFKTGPARVNSAAEDGHLVLSDREGYSSVYLMCKVQGIDNGFGVLVDGLRLGIGHTMVVRAWEAKFYVAVYDIQKLSDTPYANQ